MIKYTNAGLVTDEAQVKSMFVHKRGVATSYGRAPLYKQIFDKTKLTIPYFHIKAAIEPVEGEAYFVFDMTEGDENLIPEYGTSFHGRYDSRDTILKACPLTTGKTVGELRELVKRCENGVS